MRMVSCESSKPGGGGLVVANGVLDAGGCIKAGVLIANGAMCSGGYVIML